MSSCPPDPPGGARNPRLEAEQMAGGGFEARVLEPSPPAVVDGDLFADDPVAADGAVGGRPVLSPAGNGDLTWDEWLPERPGHAGWAVRFHAEWLGFAWSVLEELRAGPGSVEPSRVQLWPEHFDAAFDSSSAGSRRATFGASPGDAAIEEPYLYVLPAEPGLLAPDDRWDATSFSGAVCALHELIDAPDQRGAALAFFEQRQALLDGV